MNRAGEWLETPVWCGFPADAQHGDPIRGAQRRNPIVALPE